MISMLSKSMRIDSFKRTFFVFIGLLTLSFAAFAFAEEGSGSKNIFQDTDQDGLSNEEEKLYGTDSRKTDTDGDGYSDGVEVQSGYDPLRPAPGDKIVPDGDQASAGSGAFQAKRVEDEENLTRELSVKVAGMVKSGGEEDAKLSMEALQEAVQEAITKHVKIDDLPGVDVSKIRLKKQKYQGLSSEEREKRTKEDTLEYVTGVAYIVANNSPTPLRSGEDLKSAVSSITSQTISALSSQDAGALDEIEQRGRQSLEQLQSVEVPENMMETHVKAMKIAQYAIDIKSDIKPRPNDPLMNIVVLSKFQGLLNVAEEFSKELDQALQKHGVSAEELSL
jgi:hypothetical protein